MAKTIEITSKEFLKAGAKATQILELLEGRKWERKGLTKRDITEIGATLTSLMLQELYPDMDEDDAEKDASEILAEKLSEALMGGHYEN